MWLIRSRIRTEAKIHKIIEPEEVFRKTGYSRPHTIHCGPEGIYVSTLGGGGKDGTEGPPGVFIMDCETFEILGPASSPGSDRFWAVRAISCSLWNGGLWRGLRSF
jgi:hypothetical protein